MTALFGLIFVFVVPPFQNIDEGSHFFRAYQLSEGKLYGVVQNDRSGDYLPKSLSEAFYDEYGYLVFHYDQKTSIGAIVTDIADDRFSDDKVFTEFINTVIYPPLTYLPQALGIRLVTVFTDNPFIALYAARLTSLLVWTVSMVVVIRMVPIGKWTFAILGLFPMVLVQAASASSDATINTAAVWGIGLMATLMLRRPEDKTKDKVRLAALAVVAVGMALIKIPVVALLVLAGLIPPDRFGSRMRKMLYIFALAAVVVSLILAWNLSAAHLRVELRPDTSTSDQLRYVLSHPIEYMKTLIAYPLQVRFDQTLVQMYGWLGWNEIKLPVWMMLFGFGTLLLSMFSPEYKAVRIPKVVRITALLVGGLTALVIVTLLYLSWMPVGHPQLYDVWGRYFTALLPLCPLIAGGIIAVDQLSWLRIRRFIIVSTPIVLSIVLLLVINRYYGMYEFGDFIAPGTSSW